LFPTDGSGSFDLPVDPSRTASHFSGAGLDGLRALYAGAAGGAGFDLSWAQDLNGQSVILPEVRFIRVDVLSGAAEIDGISAVGIVPEPSPALLAALGLGGILVLQTRRWLGRRARG
jgi:hypothetical protein